MFDWIKEMILPSPLEQSRTALTRSCQHVAEQLKQQHITLSFEADKADQTITALLKHDQVFVASHTATERINVCLRTIERQANDLHLSRIGQPFRDPGRLVQITFWS